MCTKYMQSVFHMVLTPSQLANNQKKKGKKMAWRLPVLVVVNTVCPNVIAPSK